MSVITFDPAGDIHGMPTYPWLRAPAGLATRRQLAAEGLRPGGHPPVAQLMRCRGRRVLVAYLFDRKRAARKRPMTPAKWAAVRAAVAAKMRCSRCPAVLDYIPAKYVDYQCWDCVGV
jgi:hypothetical protein